MSTSLSTLAERGVLAWARFEALLPWLQAPAQLAARVFVGKAFFLSGLTKIADWDTTLALFQDEYHVPLLPPELAAVAGTCGELALPVLLVLGLGGRFAAAGLSVMNVVAVLSLAEIADAALAQHQFWGALLLALVLWGPGRLALDAWLWPRLTRWVKIITGGVGRPSVSVGRVPVRSNARSTASSQTLLPLDRVIRRDSTAPVGATRTSTSASGLPATGSVNTILGLM